MASRSSRDDLVSNSSGDIPFSVMGNNLHIEIFGRKRLSIDGDFTILQYTEENIKLKFKNGILEVYGVDLIINNVNDESLLITGKIISLEFAE